MTIRDKLAGWWSAWKYVAILLGLLGLSLWGNLHQYGIRRAAVEKARADVLADTLKTTAGIAKQAQQDSAQLYVDLHELVERGRKERVVYRTVAEKRPLAANCAPGQERMDAVNAGADK